MERGFVHGSPVVSQILTLEYLTVQGGAILIFSLPLNEKLLFRDETHCCEESSQCDLSTE